MQIIRIMNRAQAEMQVRPESKLISLSTPGLEYASETPGVFIETLAFKLEDSSTSIGNLDAAKVFEFVQNYEGDLFIHCDAGMSRSVGLGLALSEILEVPYKLHAVRDTYLANKTIYRELHNYAREHQIGRYSDD